MSSKGCLFVISGPSGCGKGTVCKQLIDRNKNLKLSVSATTREVRPGEKDGETYFYISVEQFEKMIDDNELLEYNKGYSGKYYGTPKQYVFDQLDKGYDVILEIEMNGAENVRKQYPECVRIFLSPPSMDELLKRLRGRGRESEELIMERFNLAKEEMQRVDEYKYAVVNDNLDSTVEQIEAIISAEKNTVARNSEYIKNLIK
jgi:guanylate kinase